MFAGRHLMDRYVWELRELVQSGQVTPTQVVQACLERVAERDGAGELRCFLHLDADGALAEAAEQTARQAAPFSRTTHTRRPEAARAREIDTFAVWKQPALEKSADPVVRAWTSSLDKKTSPTPPP